MDKNELTEKLNIENFSNISQDIIDAIRKNIDSMRELLAYYKCAIMEVETKFNVLNEQFSLEHDRNPIEFITSRTKSIDSVINKMLDKNIPFNVEAMVNGINDLAGVRVVCSFTEDLYMLADCLLKQDDVTLIAMKDYIKNPKENGYRSLHLIISIPIFLKDEKKDMKVEVQLRTIAMDFWASLEHKIRYKKNLSIELQKELADELLYCANQSADLDARMQAIRNIVEK